MWMHGFTAYPHMIWSNKLSQCKNDAASRPNNQLASSWAVKINEVFLLSQLSVAVAPYCQYSTRRRYCCFIVCHGIVLHFHVILRWLLHLTAPLPPNLRLCDKHLSAQCLFFFSRLNLLLFSSVSSSPPCCCYLTQRAASFGVKTALKTRCTGSGSRGENMVELKSQILHPSGGRKHNSKWFQWCSVSVGLVSDEAASDFLQDVPLDVLPFDKRKHKNKKKNRLRKGYFLLFSSSLKEWLIFIIWRLLTKPASSVNVKCIKSTSKVITA